MSEPGISILRRPGVRDTNQSGSEDAICGLPRSSAPSYEVFFEQTNAAATREGIGRFTIKPEAPVLSALFDHCHGHYQYDSSRQPSSLSRNHDANEDLMDS